MLNLWNLETMERDKKIELYPCTGTQERLGFGYPEGHKNLIYDENGDELFLSYEEAVKKYGEQNLKNMSPTGSICPDCCDVAVTLSGLRKHGINVVEMIEQLKSKNSWQRKLLKAYIKL